MNRNYNQYDDDNDYIFYDTNDDSSYSDDLIYEDNNSDFLNIDQVENENYNNYDYTYETSTDNDSYNYDYDYNYEDDDKNDNYTENNILLRNRTKIVTGIIIIIILFLIAWITPQFINRNKKSTSEVTLTKKVDSESDIEKLKQAALKYYKESTVPTNINEKNELSLKELLDKKLVNNINSSYNKKKSYIKLTKQENDFLLEIKLVNGEVTKKKEYHINNYQYCTSTYLCEKEDIIKPNQTINEEENEEETIEVENTESGDSNTENYQYEYSKTENGKLSNWSSWTNYEKTNCTTKAITCKNDDFNCLSETKLYNRKEKLGTTTKQYNTARNSYTYARQDFINGCSNYDYVRINNTYYKTATSNQFTTIGTFSTSSPTNHGAWTYLGRKAYQTPPSDGIKTRYVFVDNERYCENCTTTPTYTYDMYQFNGNLQAISNLDSECPKKKVQRSILTYNISTQNISVNRTETLYGTVCYKSERTRKVTKQGKTKTTWSTYNDETLLNDGYTYTGNKKER